MLAGMASTCSTSNAALSTALAFEDIGEDQTGGLSSARIKRATCSNSSSWSTSAVRSWHAHAITPAPKYRKLLES